MNTELSTGVKQTHPQNLLNTLLNFTNCEEKVEISGMQGCKKKKSLNRTPKKLKNSVRKSKLERKKGTNSFKRVQN